MNPPYKILLAEDHGTFRDMIAKSLSRLPELEIVGEECDGKELLECIASGKPDLVVLDKEVPGLSGLETAAKIKQAHAEIKVLLLTVNKSIENLISAFEANVDGYMLKKNVFEDLVAAVEAIRNGRRYLSGLVTRQLADAARKIPRSKAKKSRQLSIRETEVLYHIAEGKSNREIAAALHIGVPSVRVYMHRMKKKLGLQTNDDLTDYAKVRFVFAP